MNNVVIHRIVVQDPENMELDPNTGQPICPECDSLFDQCCCPKPWSSLETDGYQVVLQGDKLVAYPSPETYEALMLWIFRNTNHLICGLCMQWIEDDWRWSKEESDDVVMTFFEIHKKCYCK